MREGSEESSFLRASLHVSMPCHNRKHSSTSGNDGLLQKRGVKRNQPRSQRRC